jgi:hypothetical protein
MYNALDLPARYWRNGSKTDNPTDAPTNYWDIVERGAAPHFSEPTRRPPAAPAASTAMCTPHRQTITGTTSQADSRTAPHPLTNEELEHIGSRLLADA